MQWDMRVPPDDVILAKIRALREGQTYDVGLALLAPPTVGRPDPHNPTPNQAVNPWLGWPPAIPVHPDEYLDCSDRKFHRIVQPAHPCYHVLTNPGPMLPVPNSLPPPAFWNVRRHPIFPSPLAQRDCPRFLNPQHNIDHSVCEHCLNDIRDQPWSREIYRDITTFPVRPVHPGDVRRGIRGPALPQPITTSRQFLTHLCRTCEWAEIALLHDRLNGVVESPGNVYIWATEAHTNVWPYVTCTCLDHWSRDSNAFWDVCIRHRHREACKRHDFLLIIRQQNDQWLRNIGLRNGRLVRLDRRIPADRGKLTSRATQGVFRACRCGPEINQYAPVGGYVPRAFQCLGCEGVVHNVPLGAAPPPPPPARPLLPRKTRSVARESRFKLRRRIR